MRATNFQAVTMFNLTFGNEVPDTPTFPNKEVMQLRMKLIHEEAIEELQEAIDHHDMVGVADAIADALFVLYGAANDFGLDADVLLSEVARSNMSKLCDNEADAEYAVMRYQAGEGYMGKIDPINAAYRRCTAPGLEHTFVVYDADTGKVLKGPKFQEPQIRLLLKRMSGFTETPEGVLK